VHGRRHRVPDRISDETEDLHTRATPRAGKRIPRFSSRRPAGTIVLPPARRLLR
jgi:hypothetical protein